MKRPEVGDRIILTEDVGYMFSTIKKGSTGVITQVSNWSWAAKANVDGKEIDLREGTYEILQNILAKNFLTGEYYNYSPVFC